MLAGSKERRKRGLKIVHLVPVVGGMECLL
jgi:hypothetical protein